MKVKQQINALFHKFVNRETVSYVVVGVFTTVIDLVLFWICSLFYSEGNMLGVTKERLRVGNMLPGLFLPLLYLPLSQWLGGLLG